MNEQKFYNRLSRESQKIGVTPTNHSWDVLESRLDEHQKKRKIRIRISIGIAASLMVGILFQTLLFENNSPKVILEGPLVEYIPDEKESFLNTSPILKYERLKDYDKRSNTRIKVVQNVNLHNKHADLLEAVTKPHAFHPEDFASEMDYWRHAQKDFDTNTFSGNWYLQHSEVPFHRNLKVQVLDHLKWTISSEAVEDPQEYLCIPGQKKYFVKQNSQEDLIIIEVLDNTTLIIKKFDHSNNRFDEAIYQKQDIG